MAKPLVVLDSNVIVSSLLNRDGAPSRIIEFWRDYRFDLILSNYILTEVKHTLNDKHLIHKYHLSPIKQSRLLTQLVHSARIINPNTAHHTSVRDPKDNEVIMTAIIGGADYLVTGDQDLLILAKHESVIPVQIRTPHDFLHELMSIDDEFIEYIEKRDRS